MCLRHNGERSPGPYIRHERFSYRAPPELSCDVLRLDGKAIAVNLDFLVRDRLFGFKTAYDESPGKHSPGSVLQLESAMAFFAQTRLTRADASTAQPPSGSHT